MNRLKGMLVVFAILNILYYITCLIVYKINVNFSGFFLSIGCLIIAGVLITSKFHFNRYSKLLLGVKIFLAIVAVSFIFIEGNIIYNAHTNIESKPDYIIVLGAGIRGRTMQLVQLQRTETALTYIKKYPEAKVVLSGGRGPGEEISEAEAMREYLVRKGVSSNRIIKEEKSKNTVENMKFSYNIIKAISGSRKQNIAIVTSNFHVFRARFLAKRVGMNSEGIAAPVTKLLIPNYYVREYFAVIKSFLFDR